LSCFRPSHHADGASVVLTAGTTTTPLATAAAILGYFGRQRLESALAEYHVELSACRWALRTEPAVPSGVRGGGRIGADTGALIAQDEPERIRNRVRVA